MPTEDHVKIGANISREYILAMPEKPVESIKTFPGPPSEAPSSEFAASDAIFDEGARAYLDKQYPRAAELFLRAARTLTVRKGIHAPTASRNRAAFYLDAAEAWILAGTADAGRETLDQIERDHLATPDELQRARAALIREPHAGHLR